MTVQAKTVRHSQISINECWMVQTWGTTHCKDCSLRNTKDCGGQNIIKTGKNSLGFSVPLEDTSKNKE